MARFTYTALDQGKKKVKGTITAESPYAARKHLRSKGFHLTTIKQLSDDRQGMSLISVFRKSNRSQVADFTTQLATMLSSGIKLTESLSVLLQQISAVSLRNAVADIRDRVVTGESFADAMSEYNDFFDIVYVSMVRVGEVTGTLATSLTTIAVFMEKRRRIESKMVTAMVYPIILVLASIFVVLFVTIKVIPTIAEQIQKTGQQLPWITRAMIGASNTLTSWWAVLIVAILILLFWGMRQFLRSERGALIRDRLLLSLPVFGPLIKQRIVARFTSTLSTLLSSGLSMAESLRVVAEVTGNTIMNKAVKQARERILSGADIATPLRDSGVIDPAIAHMVAVGEKSGELEQMLKSISENLESSSDLVIERLSAAMEPLIVIFMAVIIGIIVYATLMPLIKFSSGQF